MYVVLNKTIHHLAILAVLLLLTSANAADLPPLTHGLTDIKNKGPEKKTKNHHAILIALARKKAYQINFRARI